MADKTQACAADQVAREMTTQELLNEVLKAELRQLRILARSILLASRPDCLDLVQFLAVHQVSATQPFA